jgi:hypothetical protein
MDLHASRIGVSHGGDVGMYASIYMVSQLFASSLIVSPLLQFSLHLFPESLDLPISDHPPDLNARLIFSLNRAEMVREGSEEQSKEWAWMRELKAGIC